MNKYKLTKTEVHYGYRCDVESDTHIVTFYTETEEDFIIKYNSAIEYLKDYDISHIK